MKVKLIKYMKDQPLEETLSAGFPPEIDIFRGVNHNYRVKCQLMTARVSLVGYIQAFLNGDK